MEQHTLDREVFKDQLINLTKLYAPRFEFDQEKFDLWYDMFSDCDTEGIKAAINKLVQESEYVPTIASLRKCYNELEEKRRKLAHTIQSDYQILVSLFGEDDEETYRLFKEKVINSKDRITKANEITTELVSEYHDYQNDGLEIPPLKELLVKI